MAGERVLVVDDGKENREFVIEYVLKPAGFEAIQAKDGVEGLEAARKHAPDLILLDLQMPRLNGLQVLEALRSESLNIPVILMTFHGSEEIAVDVFRLGVRDYVKKPYTIDEMLRAIENCMTEVRLRKEKEALTERLLQRNRALHNQVKELTMTGGPGALPVVGQWHEVSVLVAGVRDAASGDPATENAAEALGALNRALETAVTVVQQRMGVIIALSSDGFAAVFNTPENIDQHALHAVETAYRTLKSTHDLNAGKRGITFSIGIDCGQAIVGGLSAGGSTSYTVLGTPYLHARRIQESAGPNTILFSEPVALAVQGRTPVVEVGSLVIRNRDQPLSVFRLRNTQGK